MPPTDDRPPETQRTRRGETMSEPRVKVDGSRAGGVLDGAAGLAGCQRTEVENTPADWSVFSIGDLFTYLRTASNSRADLGSTGEVAYVHYGDIHTRFHHHFVDFSYHRVPRLSNSRVSTATRLRDGDLIVADASEDEDGVGKSVEVRTLGTINAVSGLHTLLLRPINHRIHIGYRGYLLQTEPVKRQLRRLCTGLKVFGISKRSLRVVRVPVPPLVEQVAILKVLSNVDYLLGLLEDLIVKKQSIKQATMQQLLTGNTRLPGFTGKWETKRLGSISKCLSTANNPRSDLDHSGEVAYIHYGDVHACSHPTLNCSSHNLRRINPSRLGNAAHIQDGDLVMVDASEDLIGVGKSIQVQGIADRPVVAGLHTILCRGNRRDWAPGFMAYLQFIPKFRSSLLRIASGTSVYAISKKQFGECRIRLPSVREQEAIVTVLVDSDAEIAALEQRRDKTLSLKQSMMQLLLTGRVRLVKPEAVVEKTRAS